MDPRTQSPTSFNRLELERVLVGEAVPEIGNAPGGEQVIAVSQPPHLAAPSNARPFYVTEGTLAGLLAGTVLSTLASIVVPTAMTGRVFFIEQQVTNFSAGLLEDMIEFRLFRDLVPLAPYGQFRGVRSLRDLPKRGIVIDPASSGELISLQARVLPTAEGGLDLATANVFGAICGWLEPARQTA